MTPAWLTLAACAVLRPDADHDGLWWKTEVELGTDPESADSDGDGLDDFDELVHGADPLVADTDGDGLLDGDEVANDTDPTLPDTDDDGYLDPWEVTEGTDPADPDSRIYKGNWPYNPNKAEKEGKYGLPDWRMVDQHGDGVAVWDFAQHGVDVLIVGLAAWDNNSRDWAAWLSPDVEDRTEFEDTAPDVRDAIREGRLYVISMLLDDRYGLGANQAAAQDWDELYPRKKVPVLADEHRDLQKEFPLPYYPTGFLFDRKLDLVTCGGLEDVLAETQSRL